MSDFTYEYVPTTTTVGYQYPSHMVRPEGFVHSNHFEKWIPNWETVLDPVKNKDNVVGIEIGLSHGDCAVYCGDRIVTGKDSYHYVLTPTETDSFKTNIAPYKNIKTVVGSSFDILRTLTHDGKTKEFADYVFLNRSHFSIEMLHDAVLTWYMLKPHGIMILNDFGWGIHLNDNPNQDILTPKLGIECFLNAYRKNYRIIQSGWQVYLEKTPFEYPPEQEF